MQIYCEITHGNKEIEERAGQSGKGGHTHVCTYASLSRYNWFVCLFITKIETKVKQTTIITQTVNECYEIPLFVFENDSDKLLFFVGEGIWGAQNSQKCFRRRKMSILGVSCTDISNIYRSTQNFLICLRSKQQTIFKNSPDYRRYSNNTS